MTEKQPQAVVHHCPPGCSGRTTCCSQTAFHIPAMDLLTHDPLAVTCRPTDDAHPCSCGGSCPDCSGDPTVECTTTEFAR